MSFLDEFKDKVVGDVKDKMKDAAKDTLKDGMSEMGGFTGLGDKVKKDVTDAMPKADDLKDAMDAVMNAKMIIGPDGDLSQNRFEEPVKEEKDSKITGFVIRSGDIVDGIASICDGRENRIHGSRYGGELHRVEFDADDELVRIEAKKNVYFGGGSALAGVTFVTKKGKTFGPYGKRGSEGEKVELIVPPGRHARGICGTVNQGGNGGFVAGLGLLV